MKKKKVPQNSAESERSQLFEQIRCLTKQVEIVRRGTNFGSCNYSLLLLFSLFVVCSDFLDFIEDEGIQQWVKIVITVFIVFISLAMIFNVSKLAMDVSENLHSERKQMKKVTKTINSFSSKIVAHVKCSPGDFARILTD